MDIFIIIKVLYCPYIQYAKRFLEQNHLGRCFFCGEMAVICHKISVKCRWKHGETFTAKIYKLGPKCRWNILIVGDNTASKIIRVYTRMCSFFFFLFLLLYPPQRSCRGVYWFHHARPSVRPSICPSVDKSYVVQ